MNLSFKRVFIFTSNWLLCVCCCCCCWVASVVSDSVRPHRRQPTRLPHPWDSPGKNTGVGCHFLLQRMKVKSESEVAQSCPTLSDPMDCSLPGSSVHGIFQARALEWGAIAFSIMCIHIGKFYANFRSLHAFLNFVYLCISLCVCRSWCWLTGVSRCVVIPYTCRVSFTFFQFSCIL